MKIGIFLEKFTDTELEKDPGVIAYHLSKSHDITIIGKNISEKTCSSFKVKILKQKELYNTDYWENSKFDAVIVYSWLSIRYTKLIRAIASTKTKLILKLDSDGSLLFPLIPTYLSAYKKSSGLTNKVRYIIRVFEWKIIPRLISLIKIKQIEACQAVIIESEKARENLCKSLNYFHREELTRKIHFIPNPVKLEPLNIKKENIILCIGRWNDPRKNTQGLIECLSSLHTDWQVIVVGFGAQDIKSKIKTNNPALKVEAETSLDHPSLLGITAKSKIFFCPSISESFGLAAAETLCLGGSVVSGPIPSFMYFANNGQSGTIAKDFQSASLTKALIDDTRKWESNLYNTDMISLFWVKELNPDKVADEITKLVESHD